MKRGRLPLVLIGSLTLAVYFAHHALNGSHGLHARHKLIERSSALEAEIARLEAVRAVLQRDVALLSAEAPDRDMVALIAADVLGYVSPDALVVRPASQPR